MDWNFTFSQKNMRTVDEYSRAIRNLNSFYTLIDVDPPGALLDRACFSATRKKDIRGKVQSPVDYLRPSFAVSRL